MGYKIKKYSYLPYECKELEVFLNGMSQKGFRLRKCFSGFFVFEQSPDAGSYTVVQKDQVENPTRKTIYLDKHLDICEDSQAPAPDLNLLNKNRKQIIGRNLLMLVCGAFFLGLNVYALRYSANEELLKSWLMFLLSCLFYANYFVFYLGEAIDYSICKKKKNTLENYKRSKIKGIMFRAGNILEMISFLFGLSICTYLFFSGQILIPLFFIILYLMEILFRYHTAAGFFSYLFSLGMYAVICSLFLRGV